MTAHLIIRMIVLWLALCGIVYQAKAAARVLPRIWVWLRSREVRAWLRSRWAARDLGRKIEREFSRTPGPGAGPEER